MSNTKINEILDKLKSFPTIPGAGARMLSLIEEPDISVSDSKIYCRRPGVDGQYFMPDTGYKRADRRK
jgi:hypothetical protein